MLNTGLLAPAAILVAWSTMMVFWVAIARLPAMKKMGIDITGKTGGRGSDVDPDVPPIVAWKSHNYSHLMEQPTLYYAIVAILTLADAVTAATIFMAWAYTGLRIAHSLWQVLINQVLVRFILFMAATFCLVGLTISALIKTLTY